MKKYITIMVLSIFTLSVLSCKDDEDSDDIDLAGTHWVESDDDSRHITFTTGSKYDYVEEGTSYPGTYTFNGSTGVITETYSNDEFNFKVVGDVLTAYLDSMNPNEGTNHIKQ